jgi:hypothetical protein
MAKNMTWREQARQYIAAQIAAARERGLSNLTDIERLVRASYPFGPRTNYAYRAWCLEVRAAFQAQATTTEQERLRAWNAAEPIYAGGWEWPSAEGDGDAG